MSCEEVRRYVSPYLDSELDGKTSFEIVRHLELCAECSTRFEAEEVVEKRIATFIRQPRAGDEELWRRALEKALRRPRRRLSRVLAIAAAVMLLALGVWQLLGSRTADLVALLRKDYLAANHKENYLDIASSDPDP